MKRKISVGKMLIVCICVFLAAVIFTCATLYLLLGDLRHTILKLTEINILAENYFIDELSSTNLDNSICQGYVSAMNDRYAQYLPRQETEEKFDHYEGVKYGIGATVLHHPDNFSIYVINVSKDGPAYKAGIKAGDYIISINGVKVDRNNFNDSVKKMQGKTGDKISCEILRGNSKETVEIEIDSFELQSVFSRKIGDYGYIQITQFSSNTVSQFKMALQELVDQNVKGLIFDVTENGGGTLDSVAEILDILLPKGEIITAVYSEMKEKVLYKSDKAEISLPMAVIVNGHSASASEIFAASIRDYEKGVLIGDTTFGKGVMQTTYKLDDGSSVKFTVSKVFSKNRYDYNGKGLEPDYKIKLTEYQLKYYYMLSDNENPYLVKAVEWLNEKQ